MSNFWRFLDLPLIRCKIELDFSWSKICIILEISLTRRIRANPNVNPPVQEVAAIQTTGTKFQINNAKLFVPVATLFINDNIRFLKSIKLGFKRAISWNKYISEITRQTKNNNLEYLIDPTLMH